MTWFILFAALTFSVVIYGLLCFIMEQDPKPRTINPATVAQMRPFFIAAAVGVLLVSVAWMRFRVDSKIGGEGRAVMLTPKQFQADSIVALALSEACSVFGLTLFFLGAPLKEFALFALGTLVVNFAFILPRGLQFWATHDRRGRI